MFQRLEKEAKRDILATQSSDDEIDGSCMSNTILHGILLFILFNLIQESLLLWILNVVWNQQGLSNQSLDKWVG